MKRKMFLRKKKAIMNISSLERDWLSLPHPQFYTLDFWFNFIDRLYSEMISCLRVVVQGF